MRFFSFLLTTAAAVTAQSPLSTTFANNNGSAVGGAVYFELECLDAAGLTIPDLDLNFAGTGGLAGSIDVYVAPDSYTPHTQAWVGPVATGVVASTSAAGTPTNVVLTPALQLGLGCKFGFAIVANGLQHAYTSAGTLPATYATAELELTVGGASNVPFANTLFAPRLINTNINYTPGGACPDLASVVSQGLGCLGEYASVYEEATPAAMDLSGTRVVGSNSPSGYTITTVPGTLLAIGAFGPATDLLLSDDQVAPAGGTMGLEVSSNGQVFNGPGGSSAFAPSVPTFLDSTPEVWAAWTDLQPNAFGSGRVWYEENPAGTIAMVTFDGVYGWGTMDPNFIQFQIDAATGDFSITFGAVAASNPEGWLVGYSPGGTSEDPGSSDLSAGTVTTGTSDTLPLALTAVGRPVQGAAPVAFDVTTDNIPASAISHLGILGLGRPATPLDPIGMPGCFLNASADLLDLILIPPATSPSYTWTVLNLPAGPVFFSGLEFNVQSVIFGTTANEFLGIGALSSNGLKCVIGTQ